MAEPCLHSRTDMTRLSITIHTLLTYLYLLLVGHDDMRTWVETPGIFYPALAVVNRFL